MIDRTDYLDLLKAKDALFSMVAANLVPKDIYKSDGVFYLYDYCESEYEKAFSVLGFEEDLVSVEEFCRAYYKNMSMISAINSIPENDCERPRFLTQSMYDNLMESAKRYKDEYKDVASVTSRYCHFE